MTADDFRSDPVIEALAGLAVHSPDRNRAALIRARCQRQMSRSAKQGDPSRHMTGPIVRRALEPALVVAVTAVFLLDVLRRALMLFRP